MAGVLAPTLSEANVPAGAPAVAADTSVGDLLGNISGIFSAVAQTSGTGGGTATQTDRDRAAIAPEIEKVRKWHRSVQNGNMSPSEFSARMTDTRKKLIASFPDKREMINTSIGSITGEETGTAVPDPETQFKSGMMELAKEHPEVWLESTVIDPETQQYDPEATVRNFEVKMYEQLALESRVANTQLKTEEAKALTELDELEQDTSAESLFAHYSKKGLEVMNGVVNMLPTVFENSGSATPELIEQGLTELTSIKQQFMAEANALAGSGRFADNMRRKFGENWAEEALSGLNVGIKYLERLKAEPAAVIEQLKSREQLAAIKTLTNEGVRGAATVITSNSDFWINYLIANQQDKIKTGINNIDLNVLKTTPVENTTGKNATEHVNENGEVDEKAQGVIDGLSRSDRVKQVQTSVAKFKAIPTMGGDQFAANLGVKDFAIGVQTMQGLNVSEDTFDNIYDNRFFETYTLLDAQKFEGMPALNNAVTKSLADIGGRRQLIAEQNIKQVTGDQFPSFKLAFNGDSWEVINSRPGKAPETIFEHRVKPFLDKHNLPFTMDGLRRLRVLERDQAPALGLNMFVEEVDDELRYLNKIVTTIKKFPEEIQKQVMPSTTKVPRTISSKEEWDALEMGEEYELELTNGEVVTLPKGQEFVR